MGERGVRVGSLAATMLVFATLMLFMVPQLRSVVSKPEMFGLLQSLSEATGIPAYAIVGAFISAIIALAAGLILYLYGTGKLSELL